MEGGSCAGPGARVGEVDAQSLRRVAESRGLDLDLPSSEALEPERAGCVRRDLSNVRDGDADDAVPIARLSTH